MGMTALTGWDNKKLLCQWANRMWFASLYGCDINSLINDLITRKPLSKEQVWRLAN